MLQCILLISFFYLDIKIDETLIKLVIGYIYIYIVE